MNGSISAIPQNRLLGGVAEFLKYLETEKPEFLPKQLDVMGLMRQLALPSASTVENMSYGNSPFTMAPSGTGSLIPQVKTGRKAEVADLIGMISGVPGGKAVIDSGTKISQDALNAYLKMIRETPPVGAINPAPMVPPIGPQKSDLGFYSQLEAATIPLQNKGTGTQFLAQIEKTPGVKPEEIKFTGLDEFLRNRETVTKPEIQQFLEQNRVNLQEVRLGEVSSPYPYRRPDEWQQAIFDAESAGNWDEAARINQAWEAVEGLGPAGSTKFSKYTLPGGENYREILLTLPQKQIEFSTQGWYAKPQGSYAWLVFDERGNQIGTAYDAKNVQDAVQEVAKSQGATPIDKNFRSGHFDQPNILAHMRVNDRVVDGKKTLFIEEIQSDWHQAGRKKGYQQPPNESRVTEINQKLRELAKSDLENTPEWDILTREKESLTSRTGVPDAPFKTSWHELSLKRAIQEASEKGYDKIAFTTGQTQAARYDLSKQIDEINVVGRTNALTGEQTKSVALDTVDGRSIRLGVAADGTVDNVNDSSMNNLIGKSLDEVVGKEMAVKIMEGGSQTISGEGLKVGGKGMEGFYDDILPKSLNKLGKKFDAKVTKARLPTDEREFAKFDVIENGQVVWTAGSRSDAQKIAALGENRTIRPASEGPEIWVMDITPKMRESVTTKGQPLFQFAPAIPATGLIDYEE